MKKNEDKEITAIIEASKVKEENLEVAGGRCWRGFWRKALNITGEIFNRFPMEVIFATIKAKESAREYVVLKPKFLYFSETWILPFAVLSAMVAYAVLAIVFYNKDG